MSKNRDLSRPAVDTLSQEQHFISIPYIASSLPGDYLNDDVEYIGTALGHEYIKRVSDSVSEQIWRAKVRDIIGREAMLLKFDEIESEYFEPIKIQLSDGNRVSPAMIQEVAELFELANEQEVINAQIIADADEFFLRGNPAAASVEIRAPHNQS